MAGQSTNDQLVQLATLILPVITFMLGYVFNGIGGIRDSQMRLTNLRTILFKEMRENFKPLNQAIPKDDKTVPPPSVVAVVSMRFSFSVYEKYLDRLDTLSPIEVDRIYETYYLMRQCVKAGEALLAMGEVNQADGKARSRYAANATLLIVTARQTLETLSHTMELFKDGKKVLAELEHERGSMMETYAKISAHLMVSEE